MITVFMPANRAVYEVIKNKAHLLVDDDMPEVLLLYCAHVQSYEVLMRKWDSGDYSCYTAFIPHPGREFDQYVRTAFADLKQSQQRLLSATAR